MPWSIASANPPRPWRDALLLGLGALAVYVLLGQQTLYGRDAHVLLVRAAEGTVIHNHHFLYFPLLAGLRWLGGLAGVSLHDAARFGSALGTAVGIALIHAANCRLGLPRTQALLTTGLVASCPTIAFFATVVEVHGTFVAFFGLAALATTSLAVKPSARTALIAGAAMGLAYCAHATAALLGAVFVPLVWAWSNAQHRLRWSATAVLIQVSIVAAIPLLLRACGLAVHSGEAARILLDPWQALTAKPAWWYELPRFAAIELWKEWLWPMLPLSVAGLLGLFERRHRAPAFGLLVGLLPYWALVIVVLTPFPLHSEHGAYLIPLAWPAALLTAAAWPRRWTIAWIAAALALAVLQIKTHDQPERAAAFAAGLRAVSQDQPVYLLAGDYADLEALHVQLPQAEYGFFAEWISKSASSPAELFVAAMDTHLLAQRQRGLRVFLSVGTEEWLAQAGVGEALPLAHRVLAHLREQWRLMPMRAHGFDGYEVVPRE